MGEPEPLPLPLPGPRIGNADDNERTRQFQVVLRKALKRRTGVETETERRRRQQFEERPDDRIAHVVKRAFGPYQSDPLMMQIAEQAERFLRSRQVGVLQEESE